MSLNNLKLNSFEKAKICQTHGENPQWSAAAEHPKTIPKPQIPMRKRGRQGPNAWGALSLGAVSGVRPSGDHKGSWGGNAGGFWPRWNSLDIMGSLIQPPHGAPLLWAPHGSWRGSCHLTPCILQINPSTGIDPNPTVGLISSPCGIDWNFCSAVGTAQNLGTFEGIYGFRKDKAAGQLPGCILQRGGWDVPALFYAGRGEILQILGLIRVTMKAGGIQRCAATRQSLLAFHSSKIFSVSTFPLSFGNQSGLRVFAYENQN